MDNILNIGSSNGLLSDSTKLMPEPELIYHQSIPVKVTLDISRSPTECLWGS